MMARMNRNMERLDVNTFKCRVWLQTSSGVMGISGL